MTPTRRSDSTGVRALKAYANRAYDIELRIIEPWILKTACGIIYAICQEESPKSWVFKFNPNPYAHPCNFRGSYRKAWLKPLTVHSAQKLLPCDTIWSKRPRSKGLNRQLDKKLVLNWNLWHIQTWGHLLTLNARGAAWDWAEMVPPDLDCAIKWYVKRVFSQSHPLRLRGSEHLFHASGCSLSHNQVHEVRINCLTLTSSARENSHNTRPSEGCPWHVSLFQRRFNRLLTHGSLLYVPDFVFFLAKCFREACSETVHSISQQWALEELATSVMSTN